MYGKIFAEIFDSSLVGECDGQALFVFMSMIVLSDAEGFVRIDPVTLYRRMGLPDDPEREMWQTFLDAIELLESPDDCSNISAHEGRRIIPLSELTEGKENRGWWIVNYEEYRRKASKHEERLKTKDRVRRYRERNGHVTVCNGGVTDEKDKKKKKEKDLNTLDQNEGDGRGASRVPESDSTARSPENPPAVPPQGGSSTGAAGNAGNRPLMVLFDAFWEHYPKKVGKGAARDRFMRIRPSAEKVALMIYAVKNQSKTEQWVREKGRFIPNPATWLHEERWDDEPEVKPATNKPVCQICGKPAVASQHGVGSWCANPECRIKVRGY